MKSLAPVVQFALKWGPRAAAAVGTLAELNKRFPDAGGRAAEYGRQLLQWSRTERSRRNAVGRDRAKLTVVRESTAAMQADRADDGDFEARAAEWLRRARDLETALTVAAMQPRTRRREALASIHDAVDGLSAEVLDELGVTIRRAGLKHPQS